jgi:outer membrane lipopolysaccharide assembly protein LptE/RlpB
VPFQLRSGGTTVIGPETLVIEKVYLADPNSAVAKAEERELMEEEMRRELVSLILRRLQSASL